MCKHVVGVLYEVAIVLQSKSINLFRDAVTGPNLSLTTDHIYLLCSLILVSLANDLDAGTAFDCVCCFLQLSICVVPVPYAGHDSHEVLL